MAIAPDKLPQRQLLVSCWRAKFEAGPCPAGAYLVLAWSAQQRRQARLLDAHLDDDLGREQARPRAPARIQLPQQDAHGVCVGGLHARARARSALLHAMQSTSRAKCCTGWQTRAGHDSSHAGELAVHGCHQRVLMTPTVRHGIRANLGDHVVHQHLCASGVTMSAPFLAHHARPSFTMHVALRPRLGYVLAKNAKLPREGMHWQAPCWNGVMS